MSSHNPETVRSFTDWFKPPIENLSAVGSCLTACKTTSGSVRRSSDAYKREPPYSATAMRTTDFSFFIWSLAYFNAHPVRRMAIMVVSLEELFAIAAWIISSSCTIRVGADSKVQPLDFSILLIHHFFS